VRIQPSTLWGTVKSAVSGTAGVDLTLLNGFAPAGFIFEGVSSTPVDPRNYQVSYGALDLAGIASGDMVQFTGLPSAFGAPPPNFVASAVTPAKGMEQQMVIEWGNGGALTPFSAVRPEGIEVDLSNPYISGTTSYIRSGPTTTALRSLPSMPLLTTNGASGQLVLAIGNDTLTAGVSVFSSLPGFLTRVGALIGIDNRSNRIYRLVAYGQYDSTSNTFVANRIYINLYEITTT
jgi:hypothetical protein